MTASAQRSERHVLPLPSSKNPERVVLLGPDRPWSGDSNTDGLRINGVVAFELVRRLYRHAVVIPWGDFPVLDVQGSWADVVARYGTLLHQQLKNPRTHLTLPVADLVRRQISYRDKDIRKLQMLVTDNKRGLHFSLKRGYPLALNQPRHLAIALVALAAHNPVTPEPTWSSATCGTPTRRAIDETREILEQAGLLVDEVDLLFSQVELK